MNKNTLRVQIDSGSHDTSAEAYLHVLQATVDALKEINRNSSRFGTENVEWQIANAGRNSPLYVSIGWDAIPSIHNGAYGDQDIDTFVTGLAHLEHSNTCPEHFNEGSLRTVSKFINSFSRGVTDITFRSSNEISARISRRLTENANHARKLLEHKASHLGRYYIEHGSVEGILLSVTTQKQRDKLTIVDDLTRDSIACYFNSESVEQKTREFWKRRVVVTGEITVERATGNPAQVTVEEIELLGGNIPQMKDLHDIDITQGIESARYISDLRNAE